MVSRARKNFLCMQTAFKWVYSVLPTMLISWSTIDLSFTVFKLACVAMQVLIMSIVYYIGKFISCNHIFLTKLFQIPCILVGNTEFLTRKWCCAGNCLRRQKFSSLLVQVFSFFLPSPKMWLFNEMGLDLISFPLETSSTNSWFDLLVLRRSAQTHIQSLQKRHKLALTQFEKALPITRGNNKPENWLGSKNWTPCKNCSKYNLPYIV